ncbi:3-oxoacyl-[acyl-carrier-protein] synthase II [Arabidopsis thaliana]|uniref:3-oxoacyl-[acyl-carrier-protein] synthase II, chloroplastic n=4 Tax=Arabidopsis TaxID=3701 RepID=KASC2_ARATH|nr:fatty acid biosynthesis 1 [Arabidopsis thaliana]NP_565097.1 fatty acid biosynthesis 1 [Arabidopsis thaliana]NP_849888.1 fatty acid biosynthesis 1 [Arabidopsis thaliana]Q9C9P4.1 RecName: Full=3-oxoacyl-[acyl-carrier-protein] synthase II, chloroplastic; AltName: Full=Beta-ketoacyl-acyl-carrier-protein synthase II; Short=AtKAS2; Short=Beta-ketoacyl-ACP synthetase 2; AltName: Full=Protein FATTY ACID BIOSYNTHESIS 1; Flags: Precursor [Arabidopsis thaliana]KAG7651744.1 Beta-ketoacyl synthase C-term|eukprot:NP_001185400.1 fatty acid biosynthesis 1 [Arabidopsis thaliana]
MVGASSSYASPLCTWFVAACMSVSHGGGDSRQAVALQSGGRSRRRRQLSKCSVASGSASIQALVTSCLDFGPCTHYNNNNALSSLFGSNSVSLNRNQRRLNRAASSGGAMAVMEMEKEAAVNKKPPTEQRRVVVTGMGVETSLGHDPHTFYENLLQGNSGISQIENFDCSEFPTRIAGEIKSFSTEGWVAPKLSKRMDKFMLYLLTAGKKALADGGVTDEVMAEFDKTKCGVLIGSAMGGMKVFYDAIEALRISYKKMNPFCVPFATTNMGSAMLAMDLGWMGPNYSISTACATSNFCILNSANHIIKGEADVMLCGGSDAVIIPIGLGGFVACRALSQRNNDPTKASRPWDTNRDGFVMGEGAGVLLLEELEHAKKRGATIYAEFLGGSFTCDAYHMTEPHPDGAGVILCIERALASAGISKEQINYINAHATSTHAGDIKEYQALAHCFGQNPELKVNSTKSMIGHLLGAAGAVEAVATVQAIRTGWVHPNINLENPDSGVDTKLLVGPKKERLDIKAALSNSFGFGGHNSSIIFAPYK